MQLPAASQPQYHSFVALHQMKKQLIEEELA